MLTISRCRLFGILAGCLLLASSVVAAETTQPNLVTAAWLANHLKDPDLLILDASPPPKYAVQHLPGAVNVNLYAYGVQDMPIADTETLYRSWGISPGKRIVLYDQGGTSMATRLFFSLNYHGFPATSLAILDGGFAKWQAENLPVTTEITPPKKGTFTITTLNEPIRVRLPEFLTASGDPVNNVLLEALGGDWHFGATQVFNKAGHIPNGVLLPADDFYNADKTFKSADQIATMLRYLGIRPEQQIYTYCGGGVNASVPFFALKFMLGYPKVKLYSESEMGWLADERDLPYWTYDAPFVLRNAQWLQWWGGPRLRMFVGARVSIVDVRPAGEFDQGHVPFALNIPADRFKDNIATPANLAEVLGPAGIDASQEAVVISGGGLTKEAALAFVMLEKLGQEKVSILTNSMDQWAKLGFAVTRDATVVGPKKGPNDGSIPPTTYPARVRKGILIADAKSTHGLFPKVLIASGKNVPAAPQDETVVHVPYTELLNPDGTPKAAKDIWSVLVKAGVPRYGELVCFSEDPGEAAVNYVILKLMGYPDIKVLLL